MSVQGITTVHLRGIRLLLVGLLVAAHLFATVIARTVAVEAAPVEVATAERMPPARASTPSITRTADGRDAAADRIIVGFKPGVGTAEQDAVHRAVASRGMSAAIPVKRIGETAAYVETIGAPSLEAVMESYRADPRVRYAEPDYIAHALDLPNDQYFGNQYGMSKVQAPGAWSVTHGSASVTVAILDCGIYEAHPDLAGKVIAREDFTGSANGTDDRCDHGTHVAGIASATTNNATGVAGLGYETKLLNGKVLSDGGSGYDSQIADGIRWAADSGANVINMSLGGAGTCSQAFQDAIDYAWGKNVVIVAAAGNGGGTASIQPANCAHVVAVASTDGNDARSGFSNYGGWVPLAAPGSEIYSTVNPNLSENNGNAYAYLSGTSMATPHVAGLAALLWSTLWGTSAQAVIQRMESTADHIAGTGTNWQYGRINALTAVAPDTAPPIATSLAPTTAVAGGAPFTLTVTGSHFRSDATLLWNGTPHPTLSVSDTQVTAAITPADLPAVASITVAVVNTDDTRSTALPFTITAAPPRVAGVTPPAASTTGGTTVRISGSAFQSGATVTFDGLPAAITSLTSTEIVVTTPPHRVGTVNVTVKNPDGQTGTVPNGFAYIGPPEARPGPVVPPSVPAANPAPRPAPPNAAGSSAPSPAPAPIPVTR
ncbi:MAG: S8 family serine peptidase [Thermomicrobiales bacterium]